MKRYSLILFLAIYSFQSYSQTRTPIQEGDYYLERKGYAKAISIYEPIFEKSPTQELALKLADANYKIRNTQKALEYYQKANAIGTLSEENLLKYGEVLRESGQSQQAKLLIKDKLPYLSKKIMANYDSTDYWNTLSPQYTITNLNINSKYNDFGYIHFINNKKLFYSDRPELNSSTNISPANNYNFLDMYIVDNASTNSEKADTFEKLKYKEGKFHDAAAYFDAVNKKLYFTRNYNNSSKLIPNSTNISTLEILIADVDSSYHLKNIQAFKYNNPEYSVGHPCLSNDGSKLYFVSDMPKGKGGTDIYYCNKLSNGEWDLPQLPGSEINTNKNEMFPYVTNSGNLVFSSNGHTGFGGLDIFTASLLSDGKFSTAKNMGSVINSNGDDFALTFSDIELKSGYFSSNRAGGKGGDDIYKFDRIVEPVKETKEMKIIVKDNKTNERLSGAVVVLKNKATGDSIEGITDRNGEFIANLDKTKDYDLIVKRQNYLSNSYKNLDLTQPQFAASLVKKELNSSVEIKNIYYEFDKADIHPSANAQLDVLANLLMNNPDVKIELSSHTDSRGNDKYNMDLSQKRAENVVKYLTFVGVHPSKMIAKGYGESRLINHCGNGVECLEEEHVQNRRTEFRIVDIMNQSSVSSKIDPGQALKVTYEKNAVNAYSQKAVQPQNSSFNATNINSSMASNIEPKKLVKDENEINNNAISENTYYALQIGAFSSPKSSSQFSQYLAVHFLEINNKFIALSGKFKSAEDALSYKNSISSINKDAFVVKIVNGRKIAL